MPTKSERVTALPAGLVPLLTMREIETYYGVSDWQILQWIKDGMPVHPFKGRQRRFDIHEVRAWMAEQDADSPAQLVAASA
ncbi:DNA binding domain-containing protein, excisionase family [Streptomyces sp. ScaeMP-e48]|uniref:helix-turn-helix transcriptional regulator n=1 Tax=Streptomyces sp. ScaeMP-e48 TaxID=1100823 RepID=UPI000823B6CC|nr:helix-turn-helix domain-containing protein [Streptomyces sp. ScaeMP-e48]SCK20471.1 DNA binding domain-containing protein, excisionase family [Streptomyces sp. ScaeMP-e48]